MATFTHTITLPGSGSGGEASNIIITLNALPAAVTGQPQYTIQLDDSTNQYLLKGTRDQIHTLLQRIWINLASAPAGAIW